MVVDLKILNNIETEADGSTCTSTTLVLFSSEIFLFSRILHVCLTVVHIHIIKCQI